jgi:hypothetical protein
MDVHLNNLPSFLLMSVLTQSFFSFVRGHLVSFSFSSARHNILFFDFDLFEINFNYSLLAILPSGLWPEQ